MFEKDDRFLVRAIVIILVFFLGAVATTFFVTVSRPIATGKQIERSIAIYQDTISPRDSLEYLSYSQRLDSLSDIVGDIRDQYQMDISIGIERLNGWLGFWLAILALVLLLSGIWQYLQVKRHDREWEEIKQKNDSLTSELEKNKKKLDAAIQDNEKSISEIQNKASAIQDKVKLENTLFNLIRTMSVFNDPMMLLSDDKRKLIMLSYLRKSKTLLGRYRDYFVDDKYSEDDSFIMELILANYHINICRCQMMFDSPKATLKIQEFLEFVDEFEKSLRSGKKVKNVQLDGFIDKLCELIDLSE